MAIIMNIFATLVFACLWGCGYIGLKRTFKLQAEWSCRIVTAFHAMLVTALAGYAWYQGPSPFTDPGGPNTTVQELALTLSLGYFLFDLTWCLFHQTEGVTMLIHHIISIVVIGRVLMKGTGGTEATGGLFCLEITNPFLQTRWLLRSAGYKNSLLYIVAESTFISLFVFFRILWGTFLCYKTMTHPKPDYESKVSCLSFYILSWVFMYYIGRYVLLKYVFRHLRRESVLPTGPAGSSNNDPVPDPYSGLEQSNLNRPTQSVAVHNLESVSEALETSEERKEK